MADISNFGALLPGVIRWSGSGAPLSNPTLGLVLGIASAGAVHVSESISAGVILGETSFSPSPNPTMGVFFGVGAAAKSRGGDSIALGLYLGVQASTPEPSPGGNDGGVGWNWFFQTGSDMIALDMLRVELEGGDGPAGDG